MKNEATLLVLILMYVESPLGYDTIPYYYTYCPCVNIHDTGSLNLISYLSQLTFLRLTFRKWRSAEKLSVKPYSTD